MVDYIEPKRKCGSIKAEFGKINFIEERIIQ